MVSIGKSIFLLVLLMIILVVLFAQFAFLGNYEDMVDEEYDDLQIQFDFGQMFSHLLGGSKESSKQSPSSSSTPAYHRHTAPVTEVENGVPLDQLSPLPTVGSLHVSALSPME